MIARIKRLLGLGPPPAPPLKDPIDVAKLPLEHPVRCMVSALQHGNIAEIRAVLATGLDIEQPLTTSTLTSRRTGQDAGLPHSHRSTFLAEAIAASQELAAEYLLSHGAPLHPAMARGVDGNPVRWVLPLQVALSLDEPMDARFLELLLSSGAREPEQRYYNFPLLHAVLLIPKHPSQALEVLLRHGCDPQEPASLANEDDVRPLHIATRRHNLQGMTILLDANVDRNARTSRGRTPLTDAVRYHAIEGRLEPTCILLQAGADIHTFDQDGDTPLHIAVRANQLELVRMLLASGADPNRLNAQKQEPLLLYRQNDPTGREIRDLLKQHGARWGAPHLPE